MVPFFVGLGVALVTTGLAIPLLVRAGVVDVSNHRSSHTGVVTRGGGLGVMAGLVAGALSGASGDARLAWALLSWSIAMATIGLIDDVRGMPVLPRLLGQFGFAAMLAAFVALTARDDVVVPLSVGLGALWLVSYVNAFNFMDGINGISALSGSVAGIWYAYVGSRFDLAVLLVFGLTLAGACLGFLPWNAPRARVFLGDVGSYGIGAMVASLALVTWVNHVGLVFAVAPLTIYLADTAFVLLKRARRGDSLGAAHREHVYQRLVDAGWSHLLTAIVAAGAAGVVCVCVAELGSSLAVALGLAVVAAYLALPLLVAQRQEVT